MYMQCNDSLVCKECALRDELNSFRVLLLQKTSALTTLLSQVMLMGLRYEQKYIDTLRNEYIEDKNVFTFYPSSTFSLD